MSYAGGRFPGNYFRRDMGRPSEKETLASRLIDRPLRPLFPKNYFYETQVIASVLSTDKENEADVGNVEIEYVPEKVALPPTDPLFAQFAAILDAFRIRDPSENETPEEEAPKREVNLRKVPKPLEMDDLEEEPVS